MNDKGFTLIELMAVVTILVILSLIVIPIIDKNVKRSKDDMYKIQIENIRMAGQSYYSDNFKPSDGNSCFVSLDSLVSNGYFEEGVKNPKTGLPFTDVYVQISNNSSRYSYFVCPFESGCIDYSDSCLQVVL